MSQTQIASMFIGNPNAPDAEGRLRGVSSQLNATIHVTDGQSHEILDYITAKNIISDNHKKSLENTLETYQFITFADKRFSEFLEKRNRIIIPDEDNSLVEFVIAEAIKYKDREGHKAQVFANASYLELKKASILYPDTFTGPVAQHAGYALNNTGWTLGTVESVATRTLTIENHTNPYEFLKRIAQEFELELKFRVEHNGNRITGRYVDLLERVGEWRGREVEFGKDLDGIRRVEKQDIVTALLGLGPEDEDGQRLEVLVEDEEALQRWGRVDEHGNLRHLIEPYEIQSSRLEMTEEEARQYTRTALDKRIDTQVTYETTIIDLGNVPGMQNKKIRFGDTIRIKDTKFIPPLYLEARVFEQNRSIKSKAKKDIKLGDYIEFTEEEVNAIWLQLRKEIQNRVSYYEMVEHTYDRLTIDTKDETVFDEGKTFAEAVGVDAKEYASEQDGTLKTNLEGYAEEKANEAQQAAEVVAEAKAELAETEAKAYADGKVTEEEERAIKDAQEKLAEAMSHAETKAQEAENAARQYADEQDTEVRDYADGVAYSALDAAKMYAVAKEVYDTQMQNIADDIADRAPIEYVDGQLQTVDDRLDDFDIELQEKADGSTVYTISEVDNMINNTVSITEYETDMEGIVTNLSDYGTRIGQNETAIGLRATKNELDNVEETLSTEIGNIDVKADKVILSVESVETDLGELGGRVARAEGSISTVAGAVNLKASIDSVNSLTGEVESLEAALDVQAGLIEGKVTDGQARSIFQQEATQFTFDAEQINFLGHVFGQGATFEGIVRTGILDTNQLDIGYRNIDNITGFMQPTTLNIRNVVRITDGEHVWGDPFVIDVRNNSVMISSPSFLDIDNSMLLHGSIIANAALFHGPLETDSLLLPKAGDLHNGIEFPSGHVISEGINSGEFTIFGNRIGNKNVFRVYSHENGSNLRLEFVINQNGHILSEPTRDNPVTWSGRVAIANNTGRFGYVSSSERFKLAIEPVKSNPYNLLDAILVSWYDKNNTEEYAELLTRKYNGEDVDFDVENIIRIPGLIAEEIERIGLSEYVTYDSSGRVDGVQYDRIYSLLIPITKDHEIKIQDNIVRIDKHEIKLTKHEQEILALKGEIKSLKDEVKELKGAA